nr:transposase [Bacteroides xylanisolvens]
MIYCGTYKRATKLANQVKEITLDMAGSMQKIANTASPCHAVIDRVHVQKLVYKLYKSCALHIDGK